MTPKKSLSPQTKAALIITPGGTCIVRTDDGHRVVLAPELAVDVARKIINEAAGSTQLVIPPSSKWVQ